MSHKDQRLVWIDMEMSGLNPEQERILEVAMIITESDLSIVYEAPVFVIHQADSVLDQMDDWNKGTHGRSGLIDKVKTSTLSEAEVEEQLLSILKEYVKENTALLCGNSVGQDRRFMSRYMPRLESFLHYRIIDVSTIKELAKRWNPVVYSGFKKACRHQALDDIRDSIEELKYYREHFFKLP